MKYVVMTPVHVCRSHCGELLEEVSRYDTSACVSQSLLGKCRLKYKDCNLTQPVCRSCCGEILNEVHNCNYDISTCVADVVEIQ